MRGENILQMWIPGKPAGTARPFTTLMVMANGRKQTWKKTDPIPRTRSQIYPHTFVAKSNSGLEQLIKYTAMSALNKQGLAREYTGAVMVDICFQFASNMSDTKAIKEQKLTRAIPMIKKPDVDNNVKMVMDAMSGIVYKDDSQVIGGMKIKTYGPESGIRVAVWKVKPDKMNGFLKELFPDGIAPRDMNVGLFRK